MNIALLLASKKTVFTVDDLLHVLPTTKPQTVRNYLTRLGKQNILRNLAYGIWGFASYDPRELATKVKTPSYISFETVLLKHGIVFQHYGNRIFCASTNTITKQTDNHTFVYQKIKNSIFTNPLGLVSQGNVMVATPERAMCDRLYLSPNYVFDSLDGVNIAKLLEISLIYNSRVQAAIKKLADTFPL